MRRQERAGVGHLLIGRLVVGQYAVLDKERYPPGQTAEHERGERKSERYPNERFAFMMSHVRESEEKR
jgi:hypothetical protein